MQVGAGYRFRPNLEYYGIGPRTTTDGRAYYKDERAWGGVLARRALTEHHVLAVAGVYSSIYAAQPQDDYYPTMLDVYGDSVPGFGERSEGVMARIAWGYGSATQTGNPERGTVAVATVGGFVATNNDDISFTAYRFELQQFIPLWFTNRVLAARGYINFLDNTGTKPVPFQRLFINEIPDMFRAFNYGRYRDRGITGVTLEYRFPFLADRKDGGPGIDTVLLTDIGQVFGDRSDISGNNLTYSYGVGFRAYLNHAYVGTTEFIWGDEGFQFRISTKQLFQYTREVLFQGREETLIH
jgi:hypothetical protein